MTQSGVQAEKFTQIGTTIILQSCFINIYLYFKIAYFSRISYFEKKKLIIKQNNTKLVVLHENGKVVFGNHIIL